MICSLLKATVCGDETPDLDTALRRKTQDRPNRKIWQMGLPYFPMFPSDFEAKTSHLTLAEDGAYNRLLRLCWMTPGCSLPADDEWIFRRARAHSDADKEAIKTVLSEFFQSQSGRYSNARLTHEFKCANEAHEKRKNAGMKGGSAKSLKINKTASSIAVAKPKQPEPEPEPYNKNEISNDISSPEPEKSAPVCISMPVTTGPEISILESEADDWSKAFPAVDVRQQLAAMKAWVIANPTKRKTPRGVRRFIVSWLDREQNRGGQRTPQPRQGQPPQPFKDGFTEALDREIERGRHERNHSNTGHLDASQPGTTGPGAEIVELASSAFRRW